MRLGHELGYLENVTKPSNMGNPDNCPSVPMSREEKLYLRIFGIPDTIKQQQAREVFSAIKKLSFSSVLDIGCAQGHYSVRVARKYPNSRVKGVDINKEKLDLAAHMKQKFGLKNLTFEKTDVSVDFLTEKHDLVLLLQVIEHLKDDKAALTKIREIMTDNGHLLITGPNAQSPIINWSKRYLHVEGHFRDGYDVKQLVKMVVDAGFKIEEIRHLSGTIGQLVEKVETYLKVSFPPLFFALLYPFLERISLFDDYLKAKNGSHTSGMLVVAVASPQSPSKSVYP